jgi:hypothetical protein
LLNNRLDSDAGSSFMNKKAILILTAIILLSGAMYLLAQYAVETFISDAATRLAYQIRDEARELVHSGRTQRTFEHRPKSWPDGIDSDYRVEIIETATSPLPGHRSIGIAPSLDGPVKYNTSCATWGRCF